MRIMVTNGGPHPPEKWALASAEDIFNIDPEMSGARLIEAQKLQVAIAEALVGHHCTVQDNEKSRLQENIHYIHSPHDPSEYLDHVMNDVLAVLKGSPWQKHFAKKNVREAMREVIANHFMAAQHIERSWHADRNPQCEISQAYKRNRCL